MAKSDPDRDLAYEQFPDLNRRFYDRSPAAYFRTRLRLLMLAAGRPAELLDLYEAGVEYGSFKAGGRPEIAEGENAFVAAEAEILWHHAAETLLRLFFAHSPPRPCPWLEMARVRDFRKFKKMVGELRDRAADQALVDEVVQVFVGPVDTEKAVAHIGETDSEGRGHDELRGQLEATARMLRRYAGRWLEYSNAYNAAKHGFGLLAGHNEVSLGGEDDEPPIIHEAGPAVTYLELRQTKRGERWHETTTWLYVEQLMGSTYWIANLMDSMWSAARARYLEQPGLHFRLPSPEIVERLDLYPKRAFSLPHLPWPLAYYVPEEDP